jgi:protein SERAC1
MQASIIFIHGLRGHPFKTWSVGAVCWPRDFLGQHIENARIVTWGYDSSFVNGIKLASQDTIVGHAKSLLSDLSFLRQDKVS